MLRLFKLWYGMAASLPQWPFPCGLCQGSVSVLPLAWCVCRGVSNESLLCIAPMCPAIPLFCSSSIIAWLSLCPTKDRARRRERWLRGNRVVLEVVAEWKFSFDGGGHYLAGGATRENSRDLFTVFSLKQASFICFWISS